ncbi:MAG: hypothetical protein V7767_07105, partial [Leeuwenhoekiella sp.]
MTKAIDESSKGGKNASKTEKLQKLQEEFKAAFSEGDSGEEKLEKVVGKLTPADEEEVKGYVDKIKETLTSLKPTDMDDEEYQEKLMEIVKNPTFEAKKLAVKIREIDRETIVSFLSKNTSIKKDQIETYADKAENALAAVQDKIGGVKEIVPTDLIQNIEAKIKGFIDSDGTTNFDFASLTSFFTDKIDHPEAAFKDIKNQLKSINTETITEAVKNNTSIEQKDIDKVVKSIEDAKYAVEKKVNDIEEEAGKRIKNLERKAVIEAENTRKNVAAAAWWLVISAIISGGAAILGSLIAMG